MARLFNFLMLIAVLGAVAIGCGEQPNPIDSRNTVAFSLPTSDKLTIPEGSTLLSATLSVYVAGEFPSATVNVHRITSSWSEMTVTWDNFGGAYDPTVVGSFVTDGNGWRSVDVTATVQDWLDDVYENHGFLLEQSSSPWSIFVSSEQSWGGDPMLELCYSTATDPICVVIQRDAYGIVEDSWISELKPTENKGASPVLVAGFEGDYEKQTLLHFDVESQPELCEIGDTVWIDTNRDGIQDEGEPGSPEAEVELYNCADVLLATTMTDANGFYIFTNLMPGDYYVKFIRPEGFVFTLQNIGDDADDSDADPVTGLDVCTNLEGGESDMTHDAGLYLRDMEGCTLTIGFWKNHAGFGPQDDVLSQYLPIWLGTEGGAKSLYIDNAAMAVDILKMKTYGKPSNGIAKLYAQLLGAKLNMAAGG